MYKEVRYFRSQNFITQEEISREHAIEKGNYIRTVFVNRKPERAEIFVHGQLKTVVYYSRDPKDVGLLQEHQDQYGATAMTIYDHAANTSEGEVQALSEWNAAGELIHTIKRLVDEQGEPLREEILDRQGALRGVRRFEYEGTYLARIVFSRADGAEIIELED